MGLFDYFGKEAADERKRARCLKKLTNMYYQSPERMAAAETCAELARTGDTEAVKVMLVRFEHLTPSTTVDRDEKQYIHDLLVDLGDHALPTIRDYIKTTPKTVYWPMKALASMRTETEVTDFLCEVLEGMDAEYTRDPEKKSNLMQIACDYPSDRTHKALIPFLGDQSEDVRFNALDAILRYDDKQVRDELLERLVEEESTRILNKLCEAFIGRNYDVKGREEDVETNLPDGYRLINAKIVKA